MTKVSRIDRRFAALKKEGRAALVTFVTAGDPDYKTAEKILLGLPGAGADLIELGMPFSDPMADGPAIQASSLRALKSGHTMKKTLDLVWRRLRPQRLMDRGRGPMPAGTAQEPRGLFVRARWAVLATA